MTAPILAVDDESVRQRGLLMVAVSMVLFSLGGLLIRWLDGVDIWAIIFWRSVFAAAFLIGFVIWRDRADAWRLFRSLGVAGLIVSVCFACANTAFVVAVSLTTVANVLVMLAISPLLAALLARVVLREPIRPRTWAAMLVSLAGVVLMVSDSAGRGALAGDAIAFVIALCLAVVTVIVRRHREVRMTAATALAMLIAATVAAPIAGTLAVATPDLALLAAFGALQFGLGLALWVSGARLAPTAQVALLGLIEPVLGPIWVWLLLGEFPGAMALVGGAAVLGALALHTVIDLRRQSGLRA